MHLARKDDERWYRPPCCADAINHRNPFAIAWLYAFRPISSFGRCNNLYCYSDVYYKAYLVEVIDIVLINTILSNYISYEVKPALDNYWILVLGSFIVKLSIKAYFELRSTSYKVTYLVLSNGTSITYRE